MPPLPIVPPAPVEPPLLSTIEPVVMIPFAFGVSVSWPFETQ